MWIEDLTEQELERIKEVGRTLHFDAIKDFQLFLVDINNSLNWIDTYLDFKKDIEHKSLQGFKDESEEYKYLSLNVYWSVFLHAEDELRMKQLIFHYKDYPESENGMYYLQFIEHLQELSKSIEEQVDALDLDADWGEYEKRILVKAIGNGFVEIEGTILKWSKSYALLDYFVGKLFCKDKIVVINSNMEKYSWEHSKHLDNRSRLKALFNYEGLGSQRDRGIPPKGWQDIDKLFKVA